MVGRAIVAVLVILGLVWMPLIEKGGSGKLFRYVNTINFLLGSPIMAIYFVGLVWPRANQPGALGGFLVGLALAAARFATEYIYAGPACGEEDTRPAFAAINYMYFGIILFLATVAVIIIISLLTKSIPREELDGLTWVTLKNETTKETKRREEAMKEIAFSTDKDVELKKYKESMENTLDTNFTETSTDRDVLFETRKEKLILNISSVILLLVLLFLWVWYR